MLFEVSIKSDEDIPAESELGRKIRNVIAMHIKEHEKKPEYTLAELAEIKTPSRTSIKSAVSGKTRGWMIDPCDDRPWVDPCETPGLFVDEMFGKWTIEGDAE